MMDEQKIRNYIAQIIDLTMTIKKQPPAQRYGSADGIATLARAIRAEIDEKACNSDTP